ncbi:hypothetical protein Syun_009385 [Stephania yunnanensis]|uniref:Uncharacterized protein n=1 Tax=Stephania yunnanensis TaxID=152371 RepID=A0AAP0PS87_9MAGN
MPPTVNEVYLHLHTVNHDGVTFIDTRSERFYRRRLELTQATPDQPVDDEAMYFNVADAEDGATFRVRSEQLRHVVAFMQRQFEMTKDGAGLSQPPPPPPPPPHDQQQPPQIDPADPPQQQDNVEREIDGTIADLSDPLLIRDGSETEYLNSVFDLFLISNGLETELLHSKFVLGKRPHKEFNDHSLKDGERGMYISWSHLECKWKFKEDFIIGGSHEEDHIHQIVPSTIESGNVDIDSIGDIYELKPLLGGENVGDRKFEVSSGKLERSSPQRVPPTMKSSAGNSNQGRNNSPYG